MALERNMVGVKPRRTLARIRGGGKISLDIFWIKGQSLSDLDNLLSSDVLAGEIIENLQSALESFQALKRQL